MTRPSGPLSGLRIIEFTHMVMGPTAGLVLADLGAEIIKVEPPGGDKTRRLKGSGAGYFAMYNRNKKSVCLDLKSAEGKALAYRLIEGADAFIENFRPGALDKLGFGYGELSERFPRLIYCSEKGFLDGPYENRTALDEVAQMMGGLAYMTGPPGQPLRAGASVIDVTGGMFGAIGILAALREREVTGRGKHITASLFETSVFLVGQHMAQYAVTGTPAPPMPARISAWAVYDVFDTADGEKVFVGVVSDSQWQTFCAAFEEVAAWGSDPSLAANNDRVAQRETLIPKVQDVLRRYTKAELMDRLERAGLPFAPINRPEDLFNDPHLTASGGLLDVQLPEGGEVQLPALPISLDGARAGVEIDPPRIGAHTGEVLGELGLGQDEIEALADRGIIEMQAAPAEKTPPGR